MNDISNPLSGLKKIYALLRSYENDGEAEKHIFQKAEMLFDELSALLQLDAIALAMPNWKTGDPQIQLGRGGWRNSEGETVPAHWMFNTRADIVCLRLEEAEKIIPRPVCTHPLYTVASVPLIFRRRKLGAMLFARARAMHAPELTLFQAVADTGTRLLLRLINRSLVNLVMDIAQTESQVGADEMVELDLDFIAGSYASVGAFLQTMQKRNFRSLGHSAEIVALTMNLAEALDWTQQIGVEVLRKGALLHDIGKIAVPDPILLKPGPLTDKEWEVIRLHPVVAYHLISPIPELQPAVEIPLYHHERWDGRGYPSNLKGEQIPLPARIFAVVDCWDALLSDRPYRKAWREDDVRSYLESQAGTHFDPRVVDAFIQVRYGKP